MNKMLRGRPRLKLEQILRALLTNKLIGPYDRSRGGRAESEALITG